MRLAIFFFSCLFLVASVSSFHFAMIADPHIGYGQDEYHGEITDQVRNLQAAVDKINTKNLEGPKIDFVFMMGDLGHNGQMTQIEKVHEVMGKLDMKYYPVIGNHDIWGCIAPGVGMEPKPRGDERFAKKFGGRLSELPVYSGWTPVNNPQTHDVSHFQNFAMEHKGMLFLGLDWASRFKLYRAAPGGELHDFPGGTLQWLNSTLSNYANTHGTPFTRVFFVQHHPFRGNSETGEYFCFIEEQLVSFQSVVNAHVGRGRIPPLSRFWGVFGGHRHKWFDDRAFTTKATTHGDWAEFWQWETSATKYLPCVSFIDIDEDTGEVHGKKWEGI